MKKRIRYKFQTIVSFAALPLWFLKIFRGVGHLPDQSTGTITEVVFRHSMFENICDSVHPSVAYAAIFLSLISVLVNILVLIFADKKQLRLIANAVFIISAVLFLFLFLLASTVARGY